MQAAHLVAKEKNFEVWSIFDHGAQVYELFADPEGETYLGCADTRAECAYIARDLIAEHFA